MKKVTVLCLEADRDAALEQLRELGVVHLTPVRPVGSDDAEDRRKEWDYIRRALEVLPAKAAAPASGRPPMDVVRDVWTLIHERKDLDDEREALEHEVQRIAPFGDFDPVQVRALAARDIRVRLFQASPKEPPAAPEGAVFVELGRTKETLYFALVHRGEAAVPGAQEVRLPERSLSEVRKRLEAIAARRAAIEASLAVFAGDRAAVGALETDAEERLRLAEARSGMGVFEGQSVAYLQGFCPARDTGCLDEAARRSGWGLVTEEPADDDYVPTLIHTPAWIKPIKAVFDMIGILPGYREVDVSMWFLLFFSLFFAMLVGDAAYGAIFLGATFWAKRKFPKAPAHVFRLLMITSTATIVWGVLTGTYFGIPVIPTFLQKLRFGWLSGEGSEDHIKSLCFWIAAIHMSIAHVWNIARAPKSPQSLAQLGWLMVVWFMFFGARNVVLGFPFPGFMTWVLAAGIALIVLFMTPVRSLKSEWFNHVMLPLNLVSSFVDVISYIRLYAVGSAGYAIASTFNTMLAPMFGHWWSALIAALLLFLAHTVNIILSVMGVMVHGIRLNTLEFAGHLGLQWSGTPYQPFKRSDRQES